MKSSDEASANAPAGSLLGARRNQHDASAPIAEIPHFLRAAVGPPARAFPFAHCNGFGQIR